MIPDGHRNLRDTLKAKIAARAKARRGLDRLGQRIKALRKKIRKQERQDRKPTIVVERSVCNQSSRAGAVPRLIVLHSTESSNLRGKADLEAIAGWFDNPQAQASSHVVVDAEGRSARCVPDDQKAWTQAAFNPLCLSIEQIGYASQFDWEDRQLAETARWVALWSRKFGIPLVHGAVSGSTVTRSGVVTHADLGVAGGGHNDPGFGFPFSRVLALAESLQ